MAHWIIEDHGFGGQEYTCSECKETWNDIYYDLISSDICPNCKAPMDSEKIEYVEKPKVSINQKNKEPKVEVFNEHCISVDGKQFVSMDKFIEIQEMQIAALKESQSTMKALYNENERLKDMVLKGM